MAHDVITVDGPAASGKSTVARELARTLGYRYVNSGTFYRAVAYRALSTGTPVDDHAAVGRLLEAMIVGLSGDGEHLYLDDQDVTRHLYTPEASGAASRVAVHADVRRWVNEQVGRLSRQGHLVVEGRDMGSVVFPRARLKVFLDASPQVRARRRQADYQDLGRDVAIEDLIEELSTRDQTDSERDIAPLRVPDGALHINSTQRSVEDIIRELVSHLSPEAPVRAADDPSREGS